MPFTPYRSILDPEALEAAQAAFDMGWAEVEAGGDGYYMQLARSLLAKLIVEAALTGERDPARLKHHALNGINPLTLAAVQIRDRKPLH